MIFTIENDPESWAARALGSAGPLAATPPAEWTYRACLEQQMRAGSLLAQAWLEAKGLREMPRFPRAASLERTVAARINHGRWLWDCAHCSAAQVCTPADPRAFCVSCFNRGDGWWPVEFPEDKAAIEELLVRRPDASQRNWRPGESIEDLQLENLGLGVDPDVGEHRWPDAAHALELVRSFRDRQLAAASDRQLEGPPA